MLETPPQDELDQQVVCAPREAESNAKIELPLGREIQVERWKKLMLLLADFAETANFPEVAIILHPRGDESGQVVTDFDAWREIPADRKSTRLNSSHGYISYAVFCLK